MADRIKIKKFENGFSVVVIEKPGFTKKFAGIIVDYGSSDLTSETLSFAGAAHFLEHKLFAKKDGDISALFEENGANVNAFTSLNETMYYAVFADKLRTNLSLLFDLIANPYFTMENVAKEREIILQELMMYQDDPFWKLNQAVMDQLYGKSALSLDIAGTESSLANISPTSLLKIYQNNYRSDKMVLVVSGDVSFSEVIEVVTPMIQRTSTISSEKGNNSDSDFDAKSIDQHLLRISGKTSHPRLITALKLPDFLQFHHSNALVSALIEIALESKFGELSPTFLTLQEEGLLQQDPYLSVTYTRQGNYAKIMAQSDHPDEVVAVLTNKLFDGDFSEEIFELQKKELIAKSFRTMDSVEELAIEMAENRLDNEDYYGILNELQQVTFAQYVKIINQIFDETQVFSAILVGTEVSR